MSNVSSDKAEIKRPESLTKPAWGPLSAILVTLGAFIGAQAVSVFSLLAIMGIANIDDGWLSTTAGQFWFVFLSDAVILFVVWYFLRRRRTGLKQLGLARHPLWKDIGYAVLGYLAYIVLLLVLINLVGSWTNIDLDQKQEIGFDNLLSSTDKLLAILSLVVLPPIVEEIVFRGFVFTGLRTKVNFLGATFITSLLFAAPHLLASSDGLLWVAGVDTLALSFVLCYLREKTGALWAPMLVHALKNSLAVVFLLSST